MWVGAAKRVPRGMLVAAGLLLPALTWANETAQTALTTAPTQHQQQQQPLPQPAAEPSAAVPAQQAVPQTAQPTTPQAVQQAAVPPAQASPSPSPSPSSVIPDLVYKGVVGKALDAVPMDPENRRSLQRGNAVVSGTLAGRALGAALLGGANPVFGLVGLAWGMYSAYNIKGENDKGANGDRNGLAALPAAPRAVYEFPQAVSLTRLAHLSVSDVCD